MPSDSSLLLSCAVIAIGSFCLLFCLSRRAPAMEKGCIAFRWSQLLCTWQGPTWAVSWVPSSVFWRADLNTSSCTFWPSPLPPSRALLAKGEQKGFHPLAASLQAIAWQGWAESCHYPKSRQDLLPQVSMGNHCEEGFVWAFPSVLLFRFKPLWGFLKVLNFWVVNLIWSSSYVGLGEIWWASRYEHLSFPSSPRILDNGLCAM